MKERIRRFLECVDDTVRWNGREWSFDASIPTEPETRRSVLVYDRSEECNTGNGMSVTRLMDATRDY